MLKIRVIPCLLLQNSGLAKTINFKDEKYIGDPINAIKIFNDKEVDELVFLDISNNKTNQKPNFELISKITSECFMPLACGGGIKSINDVEKILNLGAEKIIVNSHAIDNPSFINEASNIFGSQSIVVSIDVKKNRAGNYEIFKDNGKKPTGINPKDFATQMEKMGAGELFLNSIDRDGMMNGYDLDLIKEISRVISIPLIACGGAGKIEDFKKAIDAGASAVAAGSMFVFYGSYRAVLINFPSYNELKSILGYNITYEGK